MTARKGISSLQLSKELDVTQTTAWYMLHRLQLACGEDMDALQGVVEADETFIDGKEENKHTHKKVKGGATKQIVFGMRERGGRLKAMHVESRKAEVLEKAIYENVEKGSIVCTDDYGGYRGIIGSGRWPYDYNHKAVNHSAKEYVNGMASTNSVESVWAVLKRGYHGTYPHMSEKHLNRYIQEFAGRFNIREMDTDMQMSVLAKNMEGKRLKYRILVA